MKNRFRVGTNEKHLFCPALKKGYGHGTPPENRPNANKYELAYDRCSAFLQRSCLQNIRHP